MRQAGEQNPGVSIPLGENLQHVVNQQFAFAFGQLPSFPTPRKREAGNWCTGGVG